MNRKSLVSLIILMVVTATLLSAAGGIFFTHAGRSNDTTTDKHMSSMALPSDGKEGRRMVDLRADDAYYINKGDSTIFILVGHFAAHHNGAIIMADSAVRYSNHSFECFGNVLINQNSTYVYGNRAEYNNETAEATVYSDIVKIIDGEAVMYTYNCKYNTDSEMGEFSGGCYVNKGDSHMESERGIYNTKTHDLTAIRRVEMRDATYQMRGDSVIFNTETENAQYFTNSNIWNDKDEYLYTDAGSYDKARDFHHLTHNAYILTPEREIWSDTIEYYRTDNHVIGRRNIQMDDIEQKVLAFADYGEWWDEPGNALFTGRPSMINYDNDQRDSVYLKADTLWMYTIRVLPPEPVVDTLATKGSDSGVTDAVASEEQNDAETEVLDEGQMERQQRREERENGGADNADAEPTEDTEPIESEEGADSAEPKDGAESEQDDTQEEPVAPTQTTQQVEEPTQIEASQQLAKGKSKGNANTKSRNRAAKNRGEKSPSMINDPFADCYDYDDAYNNMYFVRDYMHTGRRVLVVKRDTTAAVSDTIATTTVADTVAKQPQYKISYLRTMTLSELAEQQSYLPVPTNNKVVADTLAEQDVTDSTAVAEPKVLTAKELRREAKLAEQRRRDSLKSAETTLRDSLKAAQRYERDSLRRMVRAEKDSLRAIELAVRDSLYQLKYGERDSLRLVERTLRDSLTRMKVDSIIAKRKERSARLADEEKAYMERIMQKAKERQRIKIEKAKARAARRGKEYKGPELEDLYPEDSLAMTSGADSLSMGASHDDMHHHDHGHDHDHDHDGDVMHKGADSLAMGGSDSLAMRGGDTLANTPPPFPADSAYKMVKAYRNVKMYRTDSQMVCDSLISLNTDSIVRLYKNPILWNESNQVTSDSMAIYTANQKLEKAHFMGKPLMIAEIDTMYYNQVKGKDMTTYFVEGQMHRNDVNGNAQTIYFLQEEDDPEVTGLMYIESANMSFYFVEGDIDQIAYKQNPEYVLYPMDMIPETQERRLPDFTWQIERRPMLDSMVMRDIRPSQREAQHAKPSFRITERIDYDRRRLSEGNVWLDRIDVLPPEIVEWRNERPSYKQRKQ
ncbi:MAG: hypothetical protein E7135_03365 [Rikenellaceae bacterium]|nr:hypothetical protein [Rikenellaceae bacterium]